MIGVSKLRAICGWANAARCALVAAGIAQCICAARTM